MLASSPICALSREWAILIPAWSMMAVLLTYFAYFSLAIRGAPPFDDLSSMTGKVLFNCDSLGPH